MKQSELDAVIAASKRERAHYGEHRKIGVRCAVCYCDTCRDDRATIALQLPALLEWIHDARRSLPGCDSGEPS